MVKNILIKYKPNFITSILLIALILTSTFAIIASMNFEDKELGNQQKQKQKTLEQSAFATFPGVNGKILFTSDRDGNYEIYDMNADGSGQRRITFHVANNECCAVQSPDGRKIAFASDRYGGQDDIFVMNADGSGQKRLTFDDISESRFFWTIDKRPSWSPDGSKIVFESWRDLRTETASYGEIYTMNADGSDQRRLTRNNGLDAFASWSPDGSKIAFVSATHCFPRTPGDGCFSELYTMNADGSDQRRLTSGNDHQVYSPSWSPDSSKIAFDTTRDGNHGIFIINADGSGLRRLTTNSANDYGGLPHWSPDGTKIGFTSYRDRNTEIYVMNLDGSNQQRLTINTETARSRGYDAITDWGPQPQQPPSTTDTDRDGMFDDIDTQPRIFSNEFSDRGLSPTGRTFGLITERGNAVFRITEVAPNPDNGVFVTGVSGGSRPATISACDSGQGGSMVINIPVNQNTRTPINCASAHLGYVQEGTVPATFIADGGGSANLDVPALNGVSFYFDTSTITAFPDNTHSLSIKPLVDGVEQKPISLAPGQSLVIPDIDPPETTIDSAADSQGNPIQNRSSTQSRDIFFEFTSPDSDDDISVFECKLDNSNWEVCQSGEGGGVVTEGEHIFQVRASDTAGNVDPTPAVFSWVVQTGNVPGATVGDLAQEGTPATTSEPDTADTTAAPQEANMSSITEPDDTGEAVEEEGGGFFGQQ